MLIVAERLVRNAGQMQLTKFIDEWFQNGSHSFKSVPPNAIILYKSQAKDRLVIT